MGALLLLLLLFLLLLSVAVLILCTTIDLNDTRKDPFGRIFGAKVGRKCGF